MTVHKPRVLAISEIDEEVHYPEIWPDDLPTVREWLTFHGNYSRVKPWYLTIEAHTIRIGGDEFVVLSDDNARVDGNPHNVSLFATDRGINILGPIVICKCDEDLGLLPLDDKDLRLIEQWIVYDPTPVIICLWGPWLS